MGDLEFGLTYRQVHSTDNRSMELRVFLRALLDHACTGYDNCPTCGDLRRVLANIERMLQVEVVFPGQTIAARHAGG